MPDEEGTQTADEPERSLHAYGDGREEDADPGSRGITGDQGTGEEPSYESGGHHEHTESGGETPGPTDHSDAAGADTGSGAGAADPDGEAGDGGRSDDDAYADPESAARASTTSAGRAPRCRDVVAVDGRELRGLPTRRWASNGRSASNASDR